MRKVLFLITLLRFSVFSAQQYSSLWYNTDNGLPQNSIKDIVKDKYGFLWISTDGGIVRYDGKSLITYQNFKLSNFSFFHFLGDINADHIVLPNMEDRESLIIKSRKVTVQDQGTNSLQGNTNKLFYKNKCYVLVSKNNFEINFPSRAYIKLKSGIYFFEENKPIIFVKSNSSIEKIIPTKFKLKNLKNFFSFGETLFLRDQQKKNILKFENGNISTFYSDNTLYTDRESHIYWSKITGQNFIINKGKIYFSHYKNGEISTETLVQISNTDIDISSIYSLYFDKENNTLYLGTLTKGLNIIKFPAFKTPKLNHTVERRVQYSLLPLGTDKIINLQGRIYNSTALLEDHHFNTYDDGYMIYDDEKNIIYLGKDNTIYKRYAASNYEKYEVLKNDQGKVPTAIFRDDHYYMLALSDNINYYLTTYKDGSFKNKDHTFIFKNIIYNTKTIDSEKILVGCSDGLFLASKSNNSIKKISGTNKLTVKKIITDTDGNIWIITKGNGFYLLKNNRLIKMPYDENNYLSYPQNAIEDSKGYLWIPSNNGLFKVLKRTLLDYSNNNKTKVLYYRYTKEDGFNINEFNGTGSSSFAKLDNGNFVLPSMDGYVFFNPLKTPSFYPEASKIYIERAKTKSSEIISFTDTLRLKNDFESAIIYMDIPYFSNNDNLFIESRLQNGTKKSHWERVKNREYTINHLAPGDYIVNFRILISPDGKFAYKKIQLIIPYLFYQTLWFKVIIGLLFSGCIVLLIQTRTQFLKTKNTKLKKILLLKNTALKTTQDQLKNESEYQKNLIQTINHDITTPIKYLSVMSQKLSETDNPKLQKQYYNAIHKSSEELYKFTLHLKNYSELFSSNTLKYQLKEYSIFEILEVKKRLFQEIASQNKTFIYNNVEKSIKLKINESIITAIIHNIIDNAVKNTFEGEIIFDAETDSINTTITITDTGSGIKKELADYYNQLINDIENKASPFKNHGLGLHLVIQLLKKIDGKIVFTNHLPKGTKVEILIQNKDAQKATDC